MLFKLDGEEIKIIERLQMLGKRKKEMKKMM